MLHNKKNRGFTLIELTIAIFILVVAIVGVYNSFSTVVILTTGISSRLTATYLAQEGIEIVRNIRDNNWLNGRHWKTGLLDMNTDCSSGCEAYYRTGTSMDTRFGLTAFGDNYLNIKNNFYSYDETGDYYPTKFKRKITIIAPYPLVGDVLKVIVLVTWKEKEETFNFQVGEYLYNWY